jgi:hypothetical protein
VVCGSPHCTHFLAMIASVSKRGFSSCVGHLWSFPCSSLSRASARALPKRTLELGSDPSWAGWLAARSGPPSRVERREERTSFQVIPVVERRVEQAGEPLTQPLPVATPVAGSHIGNKANRSFSDLLTLVIQGRLHGHSRMAAHLPQTFMSAGMAP